MNISIIFECVSMISNSISDVDVSSLFSILFVGIIYIFYIYYREDRYNEKPKTPKLENSKHGNLYEKVPEYRYSKECENFDFSNIQEDEEDEDTINYHIFSVNEEDWEPSSEYNTRISTKQVSFNKFDLPYVYKNKLRCGHQLKDTKSRCKNFKGKCIIHH